MQEATYAKGDLTDVDYDKRDCALKSKARKCAKCGSDGCLGVGCGELHQIGNSDVRLCQRCLDEVLGG